MKFHEFLEQLRWEVDTFEKLWKDNCPDLDNVDMHWKNWIDEFEIGLKGLNKESYIDKE